MCIRSHSESGQPGGFVPCEAYIKLLSEKSRLEGRCAGLEEGNKLNLESIKRQDGQLVGLMKENETLREENQLLRAENANLSMAHGPGNHTDWMLTRASKYEQLHKDLEALREERDRLAGIVEKADVLAEVILHVEDLREVADFLREKIEEARVSIQEPWRVQFDDFNAAAREMANRTIAFSELYECTEYVSRVDAINAAAKAYQEARRG